MSAILAVDLGLRCGLAVFSHDGELLSYRSTHFPNRTKLKSAVWGILKDIPDLTDVFVEGDRNLGEIWRKAAEKQGVQFHSVAPETWRDALMDPKERRSGSAAKETAERMALAYIERSDAVAAPKTELVHDVAEAILIGAWASALLSS